jgi:ABC-2 type transport system permease protein
MMVLSSITIFLMTFGITAIGVGVGALYPKFNSTNAAEIPTSFGGALCMVFSVAFIALVVMIEAWPIYLLATETLQTGRLIVPEFRVMGPSLVAVTMLTTVAVIVPLRMGLRRLEQLRD